MTIDEIRELIQLVSETGVAELEVQRGENRVRIRKSFGGETKVLLQPAEPGAGIQASGPISAPAPRVETPASHAENEEAELVYVKSPMVGTFYEAPSPDSPPFVSIGEHVTLGKVLCIVEAMKLLNEIPTDVAGIVEKKLVQNGQPVEYGEALFGIRPV